MPEILHQLSIKASPAQLFAAVSKQPGLANWWTVDTVAKPKVGAVAEFGFNHRQVVFRMQIEEWSRTSEWYGGTSAGIPNGREPTWSSN